MLAGSPGLLVLPHSLYPEPTRFLVNVTFGPMFAACGKSSYLSIRSDFTIVELVSTEELQPHLLFLAKRNYEPFQRPLGRSH